VRILPNCGEKSLPVLKCTILGETSVAFALERIFQPLLYVKKDVLFKNRRNSKDSIYTLLDPDYRSLIKFKIVSNHAKASMGDIDDAIFDVFGNDATVINNKNMTITYMITAANVPGLLAAYKLGYLPRPNGVGVDLILNVPNPNLIFGFKRANVTYNGVGWSRAGSVKKATFLNKDNIVKVL